MRDDPSNPARRELVARGVEAAGIAVLVAALGGSTRATAKAAKADFMYQDHRHDGKSCGQCKFFSPDAANADVGHCAIVEGAISREGWCSAYAPKILA